MSNIKKQYINDKMQFGKKQKWAFGMGSFAQWFINSAFNIWIFTFYFTAIGLSTYYIMLAYVIWSLWNGINDPLIGYLSDRTNTKYGRRKPFIMFATIPLLILEIVVWLPNPGNNWINFFYLLIMLFCYDTFYTCIALPYDSLFPELYTSVEERSEVNTIKQILSVLGLIFAALIPALFIDMFGGSSETFGYLINGIVTSIIVGISLLISLKWGVREREEFKLDHRQEFKFLENIKYTLKNKAFQLYSVMFFLYEYVLLLLGLIMPLFGKYVWKVGEFDTMIILGIMYIIGAVSVVIWRKLDLVIGSRKGYAISIVIYFISTLPIMLFQQYELAIVFSLFVGVGFGGMLYFIYLIIADIIDEDELKTGKRREGAYFGVTNFFMRLSMILSILTVGFVFNMTQWEVYDPTIDPRIGLLILFILFPGIALGITLLCLYYYPFTKEKVNEIKEELEELHKEKLKKVRETQ
jgi:GPH family glycoside/pentoside/hexuronide:cation symporter